MTAEFPTANESKPAATPKKPSAAYLFGVPIGELGWFATLLIGAATGFASFFAATFLGIVLLMLYNTLGHGNADYAISYRLIGFPIGVLMLVVATLYLVSLRMRRLFRGA